MLLAATFLRRHFALVHLALLAVAAVLAARLVAAISGLALANALPTLPPLRDDAPGAPPPTERDFDPALGLSLFDVRPAADETDDDVPATSCESADDTTLPLRLVGAATFADPSLGLASIVADERSGALAAVYAVGEVIAERARLVALEVDHACVENLATGALERVTTAGPSAPSAAARPALPARSPGAKTAPGPTGDPLFDELLTGARATPRFVDGKLSGVRLTAIKRGSAYERAGFKSGDEVVAVNGYRADNVANALELWSRLRQEPRLSVDVLRGGKPLSLTVELPAP